MLLNEILRVSKFVGESLVRIWPLLLISIPLAVILKQVGLSVKIKSILSKNIGVSIILATVFGAVSPLCSCSVIPVIASLLMAGVPIAPVMSFWLASPSMDPEIFFLSIASLGWELATARLIVTFLMSLSGGFITHSLLKKWNDKDTILNYKYKRYSECECTTQDNIQSKKYRFKELPKISLQSTWFVLKFLLVAFILEALIIYYVPEDIVLTIFTKNKLISTVIATIVSIPLYTTNLSALGIVAGLLEKGLNEGAGLAFLVGGATTTIPAMSAVYRLVNKKIFALYLGITFIFTILSGLIFDLIIMLK